VIQESVLASSVAPSFEITKI